MGVAVRLVFPLVFVIIFRRDFGARHDCRRSWHVVVGQARPRFASLFGEVRRVVLHIESNSSGVCSRQ